ncbi:MAG: hypothetical protein JWM10_4732 [Myxococcaceae bacterium]|nr:hypothetical protein [Myxococcaceae bacterium]
MRAPDPRYEPLSRENLREIHPSRPLGWHDYAEAWLDGPLGRFLDYGCGAGIFLRRVADRCEECWGVDMDAGAMGPEGSIPGARFRTVAPGEALPFPDGYFDTIAALEVVEHVASERLMLTELARVLKPGGRLLLTTPHRGWLTWLDPANFKFMLPSAHRLIHRTVLRDEGYYESRFGEARRQSGMLADFSLDQDPWHRHYHFDELAGHVPDSLVVERWATYYPGMRASWTAEIVLRVLTRGRVATAPRWLHALKNRASRREGLGGDQLVVAFRRR